MGDNKIDVVNREGEILKEEQYQKIDYKIQADSEFFASLWFGFWDNESAKPSKKSWYSH